MQSDHLDNFIGTHLPLLSRARVIFVEGSKFSGKGRLLRRLSEMLARPIFVTGRNRKNAGMDATGKLQRGLWNGPQSAFFAADLMRQLPDVFMLSDRSYVSCLFWEEPAEEMTQQLLSMYEELKPLFILVQPSDADLMFYARRRDVIADCHLWPTVMAERAFLDNWFALQTRFSVLRYNNPREE